MMFIFKSTDHSLGAGLDIVEERCICVCVLLYATLWGPNVPTRIVKPEIFDIVGTGLRLSGVTMQTGFL